MNNNDHNDQGIAILYRKFAKSKINQLLNKISIIRTRFENDLLRRFVEVIDIGTT